MWLVDTHAHLDQQEFAQDLGDVFLRANTAGVRSIIAVGITAASSEATLALASTHAGVYAAVGIQPNYCGQAEDGDWERIEEMVREHSPVAIGETGLDRYWDYAPFEVQVDYFDRHLRLAQASGLPFIVHTRESDREVVEMLRGARERGPLRGVMHSFTGDTATALECVDLGMHVSFAGMVTFKKSHALRETARAIPLERILIETDSPYLSPDPLRGKRNEPSNLVHTAVRLAGERGLPLSEFAELTTANARRLFGLPSQ